uniref:Uncharacterized protein n=1 Tax=Anguilla anguilla TaxID=7936 RepID=A0A0E9VSL0_ANGAN
MPLRNFGAFKLRSLATKMLFFSSCLHLDACLPSSCI